MGVSDLIRATARAEWARELHARHPLPEPLVEARPDPHAAREWFTWAGACRLWWLSFPDLDPVDTNLLWADLIAERLRLISDWPAARAVVERPRMPRLYR